MTKVKPTAAEREAAEWRTRLGAPSVDLADLAAFRDWRAEPAHREAYDRIERLWGRAAALEDDPEIRRAVDQAASSARRRGASRRRNEIAWGAAATAAAVLVLVSSLGGPSVYAAPPLSARLVRLNDGTTVHMDAGSRILVTYRQESRAVTLAAGRALFEVARDRERPFSVVARTARVTALGTVFVVDRLDPDLPVTLVEGRVKVMRDGPTSRAWLLQPGQSVEALAADPHPVSVDVDQATAFVSGRLIFRDRPLDEAVDEINRYAQRPITLTADAPRSARISGVFRAGEEAAFAEAAARILKLQARKTKHGIELGGVRSLPQASGLAGRGAAAERP